MEKYTEPINGSELVPTVIGGRVVARKRMPQSKITKTRFIE